MNAASRTTRRRSEHAGDGPGDPGDCREVLAGLEPDSVSAVVTDPPYMLKFLGKRWDDPGAFVERRPDRAVNSISSVVTITRAIRRIRLGHDWLKAAGSRVARTLGV